MYVPANGQPMFAPTIYRLPPSHSRLCVMIVRLPRDMVMQRSVEVVNSCAVTFRHRIRADFDVSATVVFLHSRDVPIRVASVGIGMPFTLVHFTAAVTPRLCSATVSEAGVLLFVEVERPLPRFLNPSIPAASSRFDQYGCVPLAI
jgi:hypothetical protein